MLGFISKLREFFSGGNTPAGPAVIRNKPGGMAWITKVPLWDERGRVVPIGQHVLAGRAVRCVRLDPSAIYPGRWLIDPPQQFVATCDFTVVDRERGTREEGRRGRVVTMTSIRDDFLQPWRDDGVSDAEVTELYRHDPINVVTGLPETA